MAAKLLHSLSDDTNTDLQRQIGCMTGIFQLFDRQQIITARRISGVSPKRLPSGSSRTYGSNFKTEPNILFHQPTPKEKNSTKSVYEQQIISLESSRPSFSSSSCSSSFSSPDCNVKISQSDPSPYDRIIFPETPSWDPSMSQTSDTWTQSEPSDFKESLRVLAKYREAPWHCDGHSITSYVSNNPRRFSYDGRETIRSAPKPRLSLDSKEGSRSFTGPSVVAKLMGLETLADADVATTNINLSKPVSNYTRNLLMEPAPWKLPEGARDPQKPSFYKKATTQTKPSVYSEIEKRLKDIEFTQSGRDLRALKQIIEAMQSKGLLDNSSTRREGQDSYFTTQSETNARALESPIVIMKPSKLAPKSRENENSNSRKKLANNNRISKISVKENGVNVLKSRQLSNSVSPRLREKKVELEKRSRPPISPDSNKAKKQLFKNQVELSSPRGKRRPENVKKLQNDDMSSVSGDSRGLCYQDDGLEVTSSGRFSERIGSKSRSLKGSKTAVSGLVQQKFVPKSIDGESSELGSDVREQPSPVSVLDNTMYADEALSPVKQIPDVFGDEETITNNPNREEENKLEELVSNTTINRKKLENIENLVKKLRRVNSTHDEAHTDYIASLCENTNPEDRYISEILLASGLLLRDLNSSQSIFQLHSSGYPINPELFLVLEQTKKSSNIVNEKKFHRKLIFDAVNEILAKKMNLMGSGTKKLARGSLSAQKLLRDLCCEIESLQVKKPSFSFGDEEGSLRSVLIEDVMNRSEIWNDFRSDLSGLVLDIERLVFRDLISEVVRGEDMGMKPGRRSRQLFA